MQGFGTPDALEDGHGVTTNAANIAIMQRTSEVQRVRIDKFEQFFCIVLLDAFWVEVLCAVGSRALGDLIFAFGAFSSNFFGVLVLLVFFGLALLVLLVLCAIVESLVLAYKASHQVIPAVLAVPRGVNQQLQRIVVQAQLMHIKFAVVVVIKLVALLLYFLAALLVEGALTETGTKVGAFWLLAEGTESF